MDFKCYNIKEMNESGIYNLMFALLGALVFVGVAFIYYANKKSKK